ncbi:APC family permease [Kibdelosporangium phytohabitans]|uniref:Amino acid permease n=1 Tax=Kibdelosporangium phytohabitans TaxID=860235 RepID=A0A0N7F4F0_9PSEU|nr:APC family permease [Kibdelosporangium phytohabitans]ALG11247.1 amino acid permease [Kibdelosporangium phytohabitans]MBE1462531.1 amino acid transporter [Kibdelosporangium phytohabitans]
MTETASPVTAATGETGRPRPLTRSIGVFGGTLLTLSCLTPASSLFVVVPPLLGETGTGTALTIALAAVLCVGVALCYSELGTLVPSAGGEYAMVGTVAGRFAGWMMFVLSLVIVLIIPPIIALGTAGYLHSVMDVDPRVAGAAVMLLGTLMGLFNLRANAWITGIFLALEVVAVAVVAFLGFGNVQRPASVLVNPTITEPAQPLGAITVIAGLAVALFVLQGFTTAVYLSEEMHNPRRTVVRTVLWTLGIGALVVLVPVVAITLGAPDITALTGGDIAAMVTGWSNSGVGVFVSLSIALAIINAVIVMVIQNSRVLYASARDQTWPDGLNKALGTVSRRFSSPWVSTLVVGVGGAALCFVSVDTLNGVTSVVVAALYLGVAIATLTGRRHAHRTAPAWRMKGWPVLPALIAIALIYIVVQQSPQDLLITLGVLIAATVYWAAYLRPRSANRFLVTVPTE